MLMEPIIPTVIPTDFDKQIY